MEPGNTAVAKPRVYSSRQPEHPHNEIRFSSNFVLRQAAILTTLRENPTHYTTEEQATIEKYASDAGKQEAKEDEASQQQSIEAKIGEIVHNATQKVPEDTHERETVMQRLYWDATKIRRTAWVSDVRKAFELAKARKIVAGEPYDEAEIADTVLRQEHKNAYDVSFAISKITQEAYTKALEEPHYKLPLFEEAEVATYPPQSAIIESVLQQTQVMPETVSLKNFLIAVQEHSPIEGTWNGKQTIEVTRPTNIEGVSITLQFAKSGKDIEFPEDRQLIRIGLDFDQASAQNLILHPMGDSPFEQAEKEKEQAKVEEKQESQRKAEAASHQRKEKISVSGNVAQEMDRILFRIAENLPESEQKEWHMQQLQEASKAFSQNDQIRAIREKMKVEVTQRKLQGEEDSTDAAYASVSVNQEPIDIRPEINVALNGNDPLAEELFKKLGIIDDDTSWAAYVKTKAWAPRDEYHNDRKVVTFPTAIDGLEVIVNRAYPDVPSAPGELHFKITDPALKNLVQFPHERSLFDEKNERDAATAREQEEIKRIQEELNATPEHLVKKRMLGLRTAKVANPAHAELKRKLEELQPPISAVDTIAT